VPPGAAWFPRNPLVLTKQTGHENLLVKYENTILNN
jgi:hypothetical protein